MYFNRIPTVAPAADAINMLEIAISDSMYGLSVAVIVMMSLVESLYFTRIVADVVSFTTPLRSDTPFILELAPQNSSA